MNFQNHALILEMIEQLNRWGGSSGKTHVQKGLFLLQAVRPSSSIPFLYVLYKHGPYSFQVEHELEEMKSYAAITSRPVLDYGFAFAPGLMAGFIHGKVRISDLQKRRIGKVCQFISQKSAAELERISTVAWIDRREGIKRKRPNVDRLVRLKPHVSPDLAEQAYDQWKSFRRSIRNRKTPSRI
jgi:uncharacterized protein YwgA